MNLDQRVDAVLDALRAYFQSAAKSEGQTLRQSPVADILDELDVGAGLRSGFDADAWASFARTYLSCVTRLHDPRYMAHQSAVTNFGAFAGGVLDSTVNNPMAIYEMGPAAAALEVFVLNWLISKIGWTPMPVPPQKIGAEGSAGGVLTHGGSLAQLTALLAARAYSAPESWDDGVRDDLTLLVPAEAHYSAKRAGAILGLGAQSVLTLPADPDMRVDPDRLEPFVRTLMDDGKRIMAIVANAGCTSAGLYDPLDEIGQFCNEAGVWFHVDGAHGGSALLVDRLRPLLRGLQRADSFIWDGHKLLRAPSLCAAVLVKDYRRLDAAFSQDASYLFHEKDNPGVDFLGRSVECTKAGLGLRLFATLAAEGEQAIADYVDGRSRLASKAAELIDREPDFEVAVRPETNIVCFAYTPFEDQLALRNALTQDGDFYITTTGYRGRRWLRLALMNPDTTLSHIQAVLEQVRRLARHLGAESSR